MQLCDENYNIKHEKRKLEDRLKLMSARVMRVGSAGSMKKFKSVDVLSQGSSKENDEPVKELRPARNKSNVSNLVENCGKLEAELKSCRVENDGLQKKNSELEGKVKDLDEKLFEETKKLVSIGMDSKSHKRKAEKYEMQVKHLKEDKRELEKKIDRLRDDQNRTIEALKSTLEDEKIKNERLTEQFVEFDMNRKQVMDLKQQIVELEIEKSAQKVQQENFSKLVEETAKARKHVQDFQEKNDALLRQLGHERAENEALKGSQAHLLHKVMEIQNQNDELVMQVEGLKGKLEYFSDENVSLVLRLNDVESHRGELREKLSSHQQAKKKQILTAEGSASARAENEALKASQAHLLAKVKETQNKNDQLVVQLEGLKGKLQYFTDENVSLELRLNDVQSSRSELLEKMDSSRKSKDAMKEILLTKLNSATFEHHGSRRSSVSRGLSTNNSSVESSPRRSHLKTTRVDVHEVASVSLNRQLSESVLLESGEPDSGPNESFMNRMLEYRKVEVSIDDTIRDRTDEIMDDETTQSSSLVVKARPRKLEKEVSFSVTILGGLPFHLFSKFWLKLSIFPENFIIFRHREYNKDLEL